MLAWTAPTYVVAEPVGVTADDVPAGPAPQLLSATTEKVAAVAPARPVSVTVVALPFVAIEVPVSGPVASGPRRR